jgi:hypothetical protein
MRQFEFLSRSRRVVANRMQAAAIRAFLLLVLVLSGLSAGAAAAGDLDPIGTVTSVVSTVTSQTTVVSGLTGSVSGDSASGTIDGVLESTDAATGSALFADSQAANDSSPDGGGGSPSTSSDGSTGSANGSNPRSPHTRFDRLPRRYERLLERIETGRHLRASIARLRVLLASASPQFRARVLRLIRLEIARLERGGLSRGERAAVGRLRALLAQLRAPASSRAAESAAPSGSVEGSGVLAETVESVASASSIHKRTGPSSAGPGGGIPGLRLPLSLPPAFPYWSLVVLVAVAGLLLILSRAPRQFLPSPVRGLVEVHQLDTWVLAAAIGLALLTGFLVVALMQAVLL